MTLFLPNDRTRGSRGSKRVPAKDALGAALSAWCREHRLSLTTEFHGVPGRQFRFDWCIQELKIAIEFEGGQFRRKGAKQCPVCKETPKGGHASPLVFAANAEKYNLAGILGFLVIRITASMVERDGNADKAMTFISQAVEQRRARR